MKVSLTNVLDNAVKSSPAGGAVRVAVSSDGTGALIEVSDDGPGIAPEEAPRLFDLFHRGSAARERDAPGFGLGLAISRAVIERQGGSASVESASPRGTRFSTRLPMAAPERVP